MHVRVYVRYIPACYVMLSKQSKWLLKIGTKWRWAQASFVDGVWGYDRWLWREKPSSAVSVYYSFYVSPVSILEAAVSICFLFIFYGPEFFYFSIHLFVFYSRFSILLTSDCLWRVCVRGSRLNRGVVGMHEVMSISEERAVPIYLNSGGAEVAQKGVWLNWKYTGQWNNWLTVIVTVGYRKNGGRCLKATLS